MEVSRLAEERVIAEGRITGDVVMGGFDRIDEAVRRQELAEDQVKTLLEQRDKLQADVRSLGERLSNLGEQFEMAIERAERAEGQAEEREVIIAKLEKHFQDLGARREQDWSEHRAEFDAWKIRCDKLISAIAVMAEVAEG
jgi:uncharacterized coiled-coil DUF342 family protein